MLIIEHEIRYLRNTGNRWLSFSAAVSVKLMNLIALYFQQYYNKAPKLIYLISLKFANSVLTSSLNHNLSNHIGVTRYDKTVYFADFSLIISEIN